MVLTSSRQLQVRPLRPDDGRQVGLLIAEVYREMGSQPAMSVEDCVHLFRTPWLELGSGLVLESGTQVCGYGYARASTWRDADCVQIGLTLRRGFRTAGCHDVLTRPLMRLATDIGRQQGIRLALAFSRSVDAIHPPVLEDLGFGVDPVSMRGFRHDLMSVPSRALPPELTLRPVRVPDELDMLCEHSARAFDDPGTQGQPLYRSYFEYEATRPDYSPEQLSIAEASGEPVAHLFLTHDHGDKRETLQLGEIGVRPEFRGRGIGSALVSHALAWARRHGAQALLTSCQSTNPAATAYWRLGFRPDPLRSYRYYTRPLDIADAGS